jgi:AhpD family alkylhydroperoxidase
MDARISELNSAIHPRTPIERLNYGAQSPELVKKLVDLSTAIRKGSIEASILSLVEIRASQLNGCAFCLDMHVKQAKLYGERELRLHHIAIWPHCSSRGSVQPSNGRKHSQGCQGAECQTSSMRACAVNSPIRRSPI